MFGLTVSSGFVLPGLVPVSTIGAPRVALDLAERSAVESEFAGPPTTSTQLVLGRGQTVDVDLGANGDRLLTCGRQALFYVGPGGDTVLCAPTDPPDPGWQLVLLDTVLGTAALAHGYDALHAGAVELAEGVVAVASPTGGGKSTLCAELVARGARLFADDLVFMSRRGSDVIAHPAPPLMTLPAGWSDDSRLPAEVLAVDTDQAWMAVSRASQAPAPLLAVLALDRRPGAGPTRVEPGRTPLELHTLALHSVLEEDRRRVRFELLADLAQQTPVRRLVADPAVPAGRLAELVERTASELADA